MTFEYFLHSDLRFIILLILGFILETYFVLLNSKKYLFSKPGKKEGNTFSESRVYSGKAITLAGLTFAAIALIVSSNQEKLIQLTEVILLFTYGFFHFLLAFKLDVIAATKRIYYDIQQRLFNYGILSLLLGLDVFLGIMYQGLLLVTIPFTILFIGIHCYEYSNDLKIYIKNRTSEESKNIQMIKKHLRITLYAGLVILVSVLWILIHEIMHAILCFLWGYNVASISFLNSAQAVCGGIENSTSILERFTVGWGPYIFNLLVILAYSKYRWKNIWLRAVLHSAFFNTLSNAISIFTGKLFVDLVFISNPMGSLGATIVWLITTILSIAFYIPQANKTEYDKYMILYLALSFAILAITT